MENGAHLELKDIREMCKMWKKQNINFIEILFTDYYMINPKYFTIFNKYFLENREKIARYSEKKTIISMGGQTLSYTKGNNPTGKYIANFYRLVEFLNSYMEGKSYKECIKISDKYREELLFLKQQPFYNEVKDNLSLPDLEKTKTSVRDKINTYHTLSSTRDIEVDKILLEGTKEILKENWNI
jgi:hypothetical protein